MRNHIMSVVSLCVCFAGMLGCAGDNDLYEGGVTKVLEIDAEDSSVGVGGGVVVKVNFSYDQNEVFGDDGEVNLVIKLPPQLSYLNNSAEIDEPGSRDKDTDPKVRRCSTGDTYLSFVLDESDLENAQVPVDGGDAILKLTVVGESRGKAVAIEAAADDGTVLFGCTQEFDPDEQEIISVE